MGRAGRYHRQDTITRGDGGANMGILAAERRRAHFLTDGQLVAIASPLPRWQSGVAERVRVAPFTAFPPPCLTEPLLQARWQGHWLMRWAVQAGWQRLSAAACSARCYRHICLWLEKGVAKRAETGGTAPRFWWRASSQQRRLSSFTHRRLSSAPFDIDLVFASWHKCLVIHLPRWMKINNGNLMDQNRTG